MIWGPALECKPEENICFVYVPVWEFEHQQFILWSKPRVHAYPVEMQMTLGSKIPNLQSLLQFNLSKISYLVNHSDPGEADRSLVSSAKQGGKGPGNGSPEPSGH